MQSNARVTACVSVRIRDVQLSGQSKPARKGIERGRGAWDWEWNWDWGASAKCTHIAHPWNSRVASSALWPVPCIYVDVAITTESGTVLDGLEEGQGMPGWQSQLVQSPFLSLAFCCPFSRWRVQCTEGKEEEFWLGKKIIIKVKNWLKIFRLYNLYSTNVFYI